MAADPLVLLHQKHGITYPDISKKWRIKVGKVHSGTFFVSKILPNQLIYLLIVYVLCLHHLLVSLSFNCNPFFKLLCKLLHIHVFMFSGHMKLFCTFHTFRCQMDQRRAGAGTVFSLFFIIFRICLI